MIDMRKAITIRDVAVVLGLSASFVVVALLAFTFLMITLILVVLGFTGIGTAAAWTAKILLLVIFLLFVISLILGRRGGNAINSNRNRRKWEVI